MAECAPTAPRRCAARAARPSARAASTTSRGALPRCCTTCVRWLFSSNRRAIAVLKLIAAMSSRTAAIVSVQQSARRVVGRARRRRATSPVSSSTTLRHSRCRKRCTPMMSDGVPRPRRFERAHEHLVQAQRVGAVVAIDVVGRDRVLQALAHLPELARDRRHRRGSTHRRVASTSDASTCMPRSSM